MRGSLLLISSLLLLASFYSTAALAQSEGDGFDDPPAVDPAKAKAAVTKRLAEYRDPKLDDSKRQAILREVLALGPEAARLLVPELAKDVPARRKQYLTRFEKAAVAVMEPRLKDAKHKREVQEMRQKVLRVSRDRNLTLEKIKDFADPARKRLEEIFSLTRDEVLKSDEPLTSEREALLATLAIWREAAEKSPADKKPPAGATPPDANAFDQELKDEEEFLATLAALPDKKDQAVLRANREPAKKLDPSEARGIFVLNLLRARVGIGALTIDLKLCDASRDHSKDMAEMRFFDHISPLPGKEEPWDRAKLAGTTASSENIFQEGHRGEEAIEGWWHSPGHHVNMMAPARRTGLGHHEGYWTQLFGQ